MSTLLLVSVVAPVASFPYDPYAHAKLLEVASWRDPGGNGADLGLRISPGGDRLLLFGYGAPGEVRITDLDTSDPSIIEFPVPEFHAWGCDWSMSGNQVVVWGEDGNGPRILIFDTDTEKPIDSALWVDRVELAEITMVHFLADDIIVAVAGRDANGTSRLIFLEINQTSIRWNHVWEGNGTILTLEDNGGDVLILDSTETLTMLGGQNWNEFVRRPGALKGGPTAWSMPYAMPWIVGDASGRVVTASYPLEAPFVNISVGDGPVLGVAWTPIRYSDFIAATGTHGGGSHLSAWQVSSSPPFITGEWEMCSMEMDERVTMISPYPGSNNTVYVAAEDGSLHLVRYVVSPLPTQVGIWDPDQIDGRGLEPLMLWYPGGESQNHRFFMNHRGSLIALRGFGAAKDLRVVDRSFETVAELDVPWNPSNFEGLEWSHGDRWLVTWGTLGSPDESRLTIRAYDTPDMEPSRTFPTDDLLSKMSGIFSMEFLPGDTVLALTCVPRDLGPMLVFYDVTEGEIIDQMSIPDNGSRYDLITDGDELVMVTHALGVWTLDIETWKYSRKALDPGMTLIDWDVNASSGWSFVGPEHNVSVWNGSPREAAFKWNVWPDKPMGLVWANGREGDLVLGSIRRATGTSFQLWRRGHDPEEEWRDLDGYTMVSELNTSGELLQMEADPAYEGVIVASFNDGTIGLYHINVTPYPPPPQELGNLSTGPIYPLDDGSGGDGGDLPWGSSNDWLFPLLLVVTIAALIIVLGVLKHRERRRGD